MNIISGKKRQKTSAEICLSNDQIVLLIAEYLTDEELGFYILICKGVYQLTKRSGIIENRLLKFRVNKINKHVKINLNESNKMSPSDFTYEIYDLEEDLDKKLMKKLRQMIQEHKNFQASNYYILPFMIYPSTWNPLMKISKDMKWPLKKFNTNQKSIQAIKSNPIQSKPSVLEIKKDLTKIAQVVDDYALDSEKHTKNIYHMIKEMTFFNPRNDISEISKKAMNENIVYNKIPNIGSIVDKEAEDRDNQNEVSGFPKGILGFYRDTRYQIQEKKYEIKKKIRKFKNKFKIPAESNLDLGKIQEETSQVIKEATKTICPVVLGKKIYKSFMDIEKYLGINQWIV